MYFQNLQHKSTEAPKLAPDIYYDYYINRKPK